MIKNYKINKFSVFWPLLICFLGLVLSVKLYGIGIVLLAFFTIKEKRGSSQNFWFYHNKSAILLLAFYLIFSFGLLYSTNLRAGFFTLEKLLSVLLLPVFLATLPPLSPKSVTKIFSFFSLLVGVTCFIIWVNSFMNHYHKSEATSLEVVVSFFISSRRFQLTDAVLTSYHHPYLGLMIATSILIIFCYFKQLPFKLLYLSIGIFLFLFLIQLRAKMSLIALVVALITYLIFLLKEKSTKGLVIFLLSSAFASGTLVFLKPAALHQAVNKVIYADGGSRVRNWESATKAVQDALLFGYGTGDPVSALQAYRHKGSWEYQEKYNAHNQYLDIALRFGLVGLFYWLFLLGYIFWKAYVTKQYFFSLFILLFSLCSFTEVLLARFHGIALFALILSIFANRIGKTIDDDYSKAIKTA